jgi:hypothetical protein
MYRCGWGQKDKNQTNILAIWLKRSAFERYLSVAVSSKHHEKDGTKAEWQKKMQKKQAGTVRLQWDPDHHPNGSKHPNRRAIQLGLRGITTFANGEDIVEIQDITSFVNEQHGKGGASIYLNSQC